MSIDQGYRRKHDFIITQTPLTITAVDWCRLIIEEEVKFVVAFEDHDKTEVNIQSTIGHEKMNVLRTCEVRYYKLHSIFIEKHF